MAARSRPSAGNAESPLLAQSVGGGEGTVGGSVLLTLVSAVAFATIPAVVAGLTLTSASSVADDLYANVIKKGQASARSELIVAWLAAFAIWTIAILLAIPAQRLNIAFLEALAFVVAASANVPALLYNLFWKPFNTTGAIFSIYGGLFTSYQTRVCACDRAGYGWSDPGLQPRTPSEITEELHALLIKAGVQGVYVLVGHSAAGKQVRLLRASVSARCRGNGLD